MDAVRNFGAQNRGSIVNVIYIVAVLVILYYLVMFYTSSSSVEKDLLTTKIQPTALTPYEINNGTDNKDRRIKEGGEFTLSTWFYLSGWPSTHQDFFQIGEYASGGSTLSNIIMNVGFYGNSSKLYVRANETGNNVTSATGMKPSASSVDPNVPMCDVIDIDLQRWMCLTVSVNGRIMDVYLDGKLARSCILPNNVKATAGSKQTLVLNSLPSNGWVSGIHFSAYAETPDQIYARYQSGPYSSMGFLDYLLDKLGFKVTYAGENSATQTTTIAEIFGFKQA